MKNLTKLIDNVILLETVINELDTDNKAKKLQIEVVFHETLNSIIAEYIAVKNEASYVDFLEEILEELRSVTEKTSIHKVLDIVENSLLNSAIKHDKINYNNARELSLYSEFVDNKALKNAIKEEDYNKAVKTVINTAKIAKDEAIINANKALFNHLNAKTLEEVITVLEVAKIVKSRKAKKAKKEAK